MSILPMWERTSMHDRFNCIACAAGLVEQPPTPSRPDTRPRWWESKGPLNPDEDPCGRPPMSITSSKEKAG